MSVWISYVDGNDAVYECVCVCVCVCVLPDSGQERAEALPLCHHQEWGKREKEPGLFARCMNRLNQCWKKRKYETKHRGFNDGCIVKII